MAVAISFPANQSVPILVNYTVSSTPPGHADECAEIDEQMFEPGRTIEARMDQLAMHTDGMSAAERDRAGRDKERERRPGEARRYARTGICNLARLS